MPTTQKSHLLVREYAKKYKMSIFEVIRKAQRGEIKSLWREIDGKRVQFIVDETQTPSPTEESQVNEQSLLRKLEMVSEQLESALKIVESLKEECKALKAKNENR